MYLFIGERRSGRAVSMGVTWYDGRLAACTLFKALAAAGVAPGDCLFCNLWTDSGAISRNTVRAARSHAGPVIAMGQRVQGKLTQLGIKHLKLVHPAARGKIRKAHRYRRHVRAVLRKNQ